MPERVLTQRELKRATLARQLFLERTKLSPTAGTERFVGLQAQWPQAPAGCKNPIRLQIEGLVDQNRSFGTSQVLETLTLAFAASLRLGESAGFAERVEGVLEVPPGSVAEGDACYRRTNPPHSPTQSIDWCAVVQAVHLRSNGATAAAGDGVRLANVRKAIPLQMSLIRPSDRVYAPYADQAYLGADAIAACPVGFANSSAALPSVNGA